MCVPITSDVYLPCNPLTSASLVCRFSSITLPPLYRFICPPQPSPLPQYGAMLWPPPSQAPCHTGNIWMLPLGAPHTLPWLLLWST
ncbi:mCG147714 [Mus musculus]|nr:mCG147714 [Mus musculus]